MAVMVLMVCGCRRQPGPAVMQLYELTDTAPAQALAGLDSLTTANLSEAERRLADFVRLKASDKVYITHTSDSTILALLDYYEDDDRFGSEVLYYAGRVYSDLGDYPTALTYFQKALQATPTEKNLRLRSAIASQTGRLLNTLKLHNQAIPYLKETLKINALLADTVNLMYNHQLLGAIYMRAGKIDSAEIALKKGMEWAQFLTEEEISLINSYFAHIAYMKGDYTQALNLIRGVPEKQEPKFRSLSLLYATQIYLANAITDTAYIYANELINGKDNKNVRAGFGLLLNSNLREFIPADSVLSYINAYNNAVTSYLSHYESENALIQNSLYNYNLQVQQRVKAIEQRNRARTIIWICAFLILVMSCVILLFKEKNQRKLIQLKSAFDEIERLQNQLHNPEKDTLTGENFETQENTDWNASAISDSIHTYLSDINISNRALETDKQLKTSDIYAKLQELLITNKSIAQDSDIWEELHSVIKAKCPNFFISLNRIFENKINKVDIQILILMKFGFSVSQISKLINVSSSAVTNRRTKICNLIPNTKISKDELNKLISLL